ncbi:MAG: A24 family peptidase [Desulfobacterota bacterium]|nr:A24 family peptidase [Thermodesulfobacteriota bacterium]
MIPTPALPPWIFYSLLLLLGLVLGSFFNVSDHRLPREESIVWPGSRCPRCGHPLGILDNLPLVSFLLLKGACRYCRQAISWRYPLIELSSGLLLALLGWRFGLSWALVQGICLACLLLIISFIDLEHQIIPDELSLPGLALGLLLSGLIGHPGWKSSLIGLFLGGGVLYLLAAGYEKLTGREGMGGGDIKLLAMIGAFTGWPGVLVSLGVGALTGSLVGLVLMAFLKKERTFAVPFGPFLSLGALTHLLAGPRLIHWYLGLSTSL